MVGFDTPIGAEANADAVYNSKNIRLERAGSPKRAFMTRVPDSEQTSKDILVELLSMLLRRAGFCSSQPILEQTSKDILVERLPMLFHQTSFR